MRRPLGCIGGLMLLLVGIAFAGEPAGVLVEVKGQVQVRRAHTARWRPARVNTPLYAGDTVRVGHDSSAAIWFPDGTLRRLSAGARWTVRHAAERRSSMWHEVWASLLQRFRPASEKSLTVVAAARTASPKGGTGPVALSPRNSRVLSDHPEFDWQPVPGAQGYRVTVGFFDAAPTTWETVVARPPFRYPDDAPPLVPGKVYVWRVEAIGATGSDTAWFAIVPPAEARDIRFTLERLQRKVTDPVAYTVMAACFLETRHCYSDAIALLRRTAGRAPHDPALRNALARLYDLVGLSRD